ncbi:transcription-repair coupling factor [Alicyclobacillus acidoterrestris]|uniref:Transcription-repair-coupling factor n=1 Tax=Alicyclobacillus acidoterrestris (strain ATCC 49025 / DSM 3922 / CIP 106132 / NCIMB 13137 / GD3B) TaxID=1356854 RepID=T0CAP2_ALIAG|nr:transcription-repair coupling factor [Alicyclobacillus acidoterrestris]EPZ53193.1 transcription-repair coupling factor [Alicyclobacillus acidoterrestris ATCC 49025]UNO49237.1 transcription-repair coupling factor [Alicyclobacillus acidoterrestris]
MKGLVHLAAADEALQALALQIGPDRHDALITGVTGAGRQLFMAALYQLRNQKLAHESMLVVTHTSSQAQTIWEDLKEYLPDVQVLLFPERENALVDVVASSTDVVSERIDILEHLTKGTPTIVVTTLPAAAQPLTSKAQFLQQSLKLKVGDAVVMDDVIERIVRSGYERVELVETRGQFSLRGGILDIFPMSAQHPYRIEWFDTDVDSIRTFDPASQRSLEKLDEISFGPASDLLVPPAAAKLAASKLEKHLEARLRTVTDLEVRDRLQTVVGADIRKLESGQAFSGLARYSALFGNELNTLFDYMPGDYFICLDEPSRLGERAKSLEKEFSEWMSDALMRGDMLSGTVEPIDYEALVADVPRGKVQFSTFTRAGSGQRFSQVLNVTAKSMQNFHGQMNVLKSEVARWQKSGLHIVFAAATKERADHLERVLEDYRIDATRVEEFTEAAAPQILTANLSSGFELPLHRLVVVVETEVFTAKRKHRRSRVELTDAERIKSYQELNVGDYVVHVNHGIGKYLGIKTLEVDGRHKDYLYLSYAGNDSLYVPVEQIDQIQRYIGSGEKEPKLYHLGGNEWQKVKSRVSKTVKDIAEDLVKLYAAREATPGHAFSPDTPWQVDFENMFPYEETPDQLRAIADIKRDMERSRPMDRLLCGDVGYGKTEVAVRAAFKAVMDGKQVAVLVPTTILAQQHYETFKERFAGFPVTIDMLSRFRTRKESQACIKGLKDGSVDIVIGTHRLLQKSIQFKDLGLLIVDEEQRFGVTHKERLKQLRANVDCLTLTATPIPRTLHMSMMGVRDLSVIETPPENRFPVQTYVVEYNEGLIREALERELSRGGQVYFVYNQVQSIHGMAERIGRLVPDARIAVAHGQMAEDELERVMLDFLEGETDVLVTTTIIETGLDISNVNTLIVYDADRFGLSQLYQLRGRVGRSNRIAYAYFTYQRDKVLNEIAEKRLSAIKEFTELGSGFKIAMRDLSIRGAGNLLGAEQHGFINSVGFDMYSEMLAQAVRELRGEQVKQAPEPTIDLPVEAYLPDSYIRDAAQKIQMYKRFKHVQTLSEANDLEEELEDRFGDLPAEVRNLLDVTRLKSLAVQAGADQISAHGAETAIRFPGDTGTPIDYGKLLSMTMKHQGQPTRRPNGLLFVSFRTKGMSDQELLKKLRDFLGDYVESLRGAGGTVETVAEVK